jgi:hypothetical protein
MTTQPRHRPPRRFPEAERKIIACELGTCPHCGAPLRPRKQWHMRKYVQTLSGPVYVAGKSKKCVNPNCSHPGQFYYASRVWLISLPKSTYGLDVLAFIGWRHEHEHKQLVEIQQELNRRGILINERNVGKLYRQFLALLGAMKEASRCVLRDTVGQHGGLIWAVDALQPEGCETLLYVLYEVLSGTPVAAIQCAHVTATGLVNWLKPYQDLFPVLATLSDGEETIELALKTCWPQAPHQRCQAHFLSNLAEAVLDDDDELRQNLRHDLGGLPAVPERVTPSENERSEPGDKASSPLFGFPASAEMGNWSSWKPESVRRSAMQ